MEIIDSTASLETSVKQVVSDDVKELTSYFRALLSGKNPPIQQVIDCGVVPCLIRFLQIDENAALQVEAVGAIANIASSCRSDHIQYLVKIGVVPILIRLLSSTSDEIRAHAMMILGVIAGYSVEYRDLVLEAGVLPVLLATTADCTDLARVGIIRHVLRVLCSLCRRLPIPALSAVEPALPLLARSLFSEDIETVEKACHSFKILCAGGDHYIQAVLQVGVTPRLIELIQRKSTKILSLVIGTIGYSMSDKSQLQFMLNDTVLDHPDQDIMIIAGDQIQTMIDGGIFPKLFEVLKEEQCTTNKDGACIVYNSILYGNPKQVMYLMDEGVIRLLSSLLQVKDVEVVRMAVGGLEKILQRNMYDYDLLETVVRNLCDETDGINALDRLHLHNDKTISVGTKNIIQLMFGKHLISKDASNQLRSMEYFANILGSKNCPIQPFIDCGVVPYFIEFLQLDENPILQYTAAVAIINIAASDTSDHIRYLIEIGVVPILIRLLSSPLDDVREVVAKALGNIGDGNNIEYRDRVLAADALPALLGAAEDCKEPSNLLVMKQIAYALSCFSCGGEPYADLRPALPLLARLLTFHDEEIIQDACSTLLYISSVADIDAILQDNLRIVLRLMELLVGSTSTQILTLTLKTLGNIASGNERQTQSVIITLPSLLWLLDYPDKGVHVEVCWTLSNITAGTRDQKQAVIDAAIFPKLFEIIKSSGPKVQKEAVYSINNVAIGGTDEQVWYLMNEGVVPLLCSLLRDEQIEAFGEEILVSLSNFLKAGKKRGKLKDVIGMVLDCDGIDKIKELRNHKNRQILTHAKDIVKAFFR